MATLKKLILVTLVGALLLCSMSVGMAEAANGSIMFLSSVSSGPTYDALMCILEGMGDALGYDIKVA